MGEPQDLTPEEAVAKSSDVYSDLKETVADQNYTEQESKQRHYWAGQYRQALETLGGQSVEAKDLPDGVTSDDVYKAKRVLQAFVSKYTQVSSENDTGI